MSKNKLILTLAVIILPVLYIYINYSGVINKVKLASKTWHSKINIYLSEEKLNRPFENLEGIRSLSISSDIRYLVDKTYIHQSVVHTYDENNNPLFSIDISNSGIWKYDQSYIFLEPGEINESLVSGQNVSENSIKKFQATFLNHMQKTRHVKVVNEHTILMTSVDGSSRVWIAN